MSSTDNESKDLPNFDVMSNFFDTWNIDELKSYKKKGLEKSAIHTLNQLDEEDGLKDKTILDVGCGAGILLHEAIKTGGARAIGFDLSPVSIQAAKALSVKQGIEDRVLFEIKNFSTDDNQLMEDVDVIIFHRVLCCVPFVVVEKFLETARRGNPEFISITVPLANVIWRILGFPFMFMIYKFAGFWNYQHRHRKIHKILSAKGYRLAKNNRSGTWRTFLFRRR